MMHLRLEQDAVRDLSLAYDWYEAQRPGLGEEFLATIEAVFAQIQERPESFAELKPDVRRATVRRFPYGVYYYVAANAAHVFAVLHFKRDPSVWERRMR
jgi:plasmid stabilization system protein ParE